ncbi:MAG: hypothetical protein FWG15_02465 [Propionibacteriaceae bacterium]|nr:hypothetical protein [Propionibacteriaceae bacterium]
MTRDPRTPFNVWGLQPAPLMHTPPKRPKNSRAAWVVLITVMVLGLIGGGGYFAYGHYFHKPPVTTNTPNPSAPAPSGPMSTDLFVSFALRDTNPRGHLDTEDDKWLVGFTQSGKEIEIYHLTTDAPWGSRFAVSGHNIYIMECAGEKHATIVSINYSNSDGPFTPIHQVDLNICPRDWTVVQDKVYYQDDRPGDWQPESPIYVLDVETRMSEPLVIDCMRTLDYTGYPVLLHQATQDTLFINIDTLSVCAYTPDTGKTTTIDNIELVLIALSSTMVHYSIRSQGDGYDTDQGYSRALFEYDTATGISRYIGVQSQYHQGCELRMYPSPVADGFFYFKECNTWDEPTEKFMEQHLMFAVPGHQPAVVANLDGYPDAAHTDPEDHFRFTTILPISDDKIMVLAASYDQCLTRTFTLDGELLDSSDGGTNYQNVQYPRYSDS